MIGIIKPDSPGSTRASGDRGRFFAIGSPQKGVSAQECFSVYTGPVPKEGRTAAGKKDPEKLLRASGLAAALKAVERLTALLDDPETSHADVVKAATLIFDRVYPAASGAGDPGGDYEICVKEE